MRRFLCLVLFVALATILPAVTVSGDDKPAAAATPSSYYPLKDTTEWIYQVKAPNGGATPTFISVRVTKHEKIGDVDCGVVETKIGDNTISQEDMAEQPDGVYRYAVQGVRATKPLCILKLPPKEGDTWTFDLGVANDTLKGSFKAGKDSITVPAGKYDAVTAFTTDCELNGVKAEFKYWFMPGVGIVRQSMSFQGQETVAELKEYKPAK